jgi:hypothetical protein
VCWDDPDTSRHTRLAYNCVLVECWCEWVVYTCVVTHAQAPAASLAAGAGPLPPSWRTWRSLFVFSAGSNRLTGTLPPAWVELPGLIILDVSINRLNGTLPAAWGRSASLQSVLLSNNMLSGTLPPTWRMDWITVAWNNLTGPLPPSWGASTTLGLSGNNLSGSVPSGWGGARIQQVSLNDNPRLQGCLPRAWRSRAEFTLSAIRPGTPPMSFRRGAQARAAAARRGGDGSLSDGLSDVLSPAFNSAGDGSGAVAVGVALQGTALTGYC